MDQVVIGRGSHTATFRSVSQSTRPSNAGGSFVVELQAEGLRVEREVFMVSSDWDSLAVFFLDLAESWRGWDGEKSWHSIEYDLSIKATADAAGHCHLEFTVRDGPIYTWRARVGGFSIDAGEEMTTAAHSFRSWIVR